MASFAPLRSLLFHPKRFFSAEAEPGIPSALLTWFLVSLIPLALALLLVGTRLSWIPIPTPEAGLVAILTTYGNQLLGLAVLAVLTHIFASLLGGRAGFAASFQSIAYGQVPVLLLSWLVFLHPLAALALLVAGLWALYITYTGLSTLHKMSEWRAFLAFLIPALILYAVRSLLSL